MDIKLFLDPVSQASVNPDLPNGSFQKSIFINQGKMYDLDGIDIAILGVRDHRVKGGSPEESLEQFRKELYKLSKNTGLNRVLDLGDLRNGPEARDTNLRLMEVCEHLLGKDILPVIVGGTHDFDIGQYRAYEAHEKLITLLNVDARFDLNEEGDPSQSHVADIIKHDPNFLFNYIQMGYQAYFVDPDQVGIMERLSFEAVRLGDIRDNVKELEPIIRDADMLSFDLSALQSHYFPACNTSNVFGLSGEEACQICWYAGQNDKLSSVGFYEYVESKDTARKPSAQLLATMVWYFIEGYYHRKGDKNFLSNDYLVYEVAFDDRPETIRFYKSKRSEKWWMEVPDENSDSVFLRNRMIPCSYSDYQTATNGDYPQRWLNTISRD
ncbi:MAG: formimidoylglutamase [Cyclobacteriaceae bacterium]